jgi:hypothetical protein
MPQRFPCSRRKTFVIEIRLTVIYDPNDPRLAEADKLAKRQKIVETLCHDADELTQLEFIENLRPHRRIRNEPPLARIPRVPITYLRFTEDQVIQPSFIEKHLVPYLGANVIDFPGSHAAFLAHPGLMVDYHLNIAGGKTSFPTIPPANGSGELVPEPSVE